MREQSLRLKEAFFCSLKPDKMFTSEKVLMDEYKKGFLSDSEVKNSMEMADIYFIKNERDQRPYKHFKKVFFLAKMRRRFTR